MLNVNFSQLKIMFGLYVITPQGDERVEEFVQEVLEAGARVVQLREKDKARAKRLGKQLKTVTDKKGALLIINDWVDVAKNIGADGVHLGQEDAPVREARAALGVDKLIGKSTHSLKEALEAEKEGADYVGIGPIYPTKSKDCKAIGPGVIKELKKKLTIPFVAIGGINEENIDEVLQAGAANVALISALTEAPNLGETVKFFIKKTGGG
jgi:thiamine-phosphate pyrophosphorylase